MPRTITESLPWPMQRLLVELDRTSAGNLRITLTATSDRDDGKKGSTFTITLDAPASLVSALNPLYRTLVDSVN